MGKRKIKLLNKQQISIIGVVMIAVLGVSIFAISSALTGFFHIEPENGISNGVTSLASQDASGGSYVQFSSSSSLSDDLSNFFPLGVWIVPTYDFDKWKSRGANTLIHHPYGSDLASWDEAARQKGLKVISGSSATANPPSNKIAYIHQDEPDGIFQQVPYATLQQNYNQMKSIDPDTNVLINFIGDLNQYDLQTGEGGPDWYRKYIAAADWVSADQYPINKGRPITELGVTIDKLRSWTDKPVFAFIETGEYDTVSNQNPGPGPTPGQLRAEVWSAIVHGVRGLYYFPQRVDSTGFQFDVTPPEVAAEITKQNNLVTSLTSVLQQGEINPSGMGASVSSGLEVGWRNHSSGKYFFVVNLTGSIKNNQTISLNGIGGASSVEVYQENRSVSISGSSITDNFGPYDVHIYRVQ